MKFYHVHFEKLGSKFNPELNHQTKHYLDHRILFISLVRLTLILLSSILHLSLLKIIIIKLTFYLDTISTLQNNARLRIVKRTHTLSTQIQSFTFFFKLLSFLSLYFFIFSLPTAESQIWAGPVAEALAKPCLTVLQPAKGRDANKEQTAACGLAQISGYRQAFGRLLLPASFMFWEEDSHPLLDLQMYVINELSFASGPCISIQVRCPTWPELFIYYVSVFFLILRRPRTPPLRFINTLAGQIAASGA